MNTRTLGQGLQISEVGLGCMTMNTSLMGPPPPS